MGCRRTRERGKKEKGRRRGAVQRGVKEERGPGRGCRESMRKVIELIKLEKI